MSIFCPITTDAENKMDQSLRTANVMQRALSAGKCVQKKRKCFCFFPDWMKTWREIFSQLQVTQKPKRLNLALIEEWFNRPTRLTL